MHLLIRFSDQLTIVSTAQISGEYVDTSLCLWVLPDGRVLGCDPKIGFYEDGSKSQVHARYFAQA
jgi:hypothetical protein